MPEIDEPREVLAGLVERVTFHNEENGFRVLRVKARGDPYRTCGVNFGWRMSDGQWQNDHTHGLQLRAQIFKTLAPTSIEGRE